MSLSFLVNWTSKNELFKKTSALPPGIVKAEIYIQFTQTKMLANTD
jgi:hypothetical protein